jgi:Ni/Fe-hydrogenase subunit HybB-like protein|tara:strand:- start:129 stop:557 length:429 start_codon:yes stop_codon:yes gene_type:complete
MSQDSTPDDDILSETKSLWKVIGLGAVTASMCCLPSVIWVLFAGSSAIIAADQLSNNLYYGNVRPIIYVIAIAMVGTGLVIHFRSRGVCTLDQAKKERRRIINTTLAVLTATFVIYFIWNYIILELIGIALGLPWADSAIWK